MSGRSHRLVLIADRIGNFVDKSIVKSTFGALPPPKVTRNLFEPGDQWFDLPSGLVRAEEQLAGKQVPRVRIERSEEHTSELQSRQYLVCRLLLEKKKSKRSRPDPPPRIARWAIP